MSDIKKMWGDFQARPFPEDCAGASIEGVDLTSLDTFAAGCIDTFVERKGRLDSRRISILRKCSKELEVVVKNLNGEARSYFEQLQSLSEKVLQSVK
ncbi:MAG TPA: hypothetical protein VIQ24_06425 [Pyrinomonadaceae bacterium]